MKGKTKPRIFKFVILAMLATILAGFFGVGGTKSADPKPIDPSNAPIDAEKFFSGDPAYKPDLYDWITIENKSLNKNGQNLEHAFRVKTIKGKGFQFDATFKQVYTKSNEELFYYQWTESDYNIAGILETSIKYFIGIDGFQNYSRNEPTKIECKKLANVNVYRMQNHPTYFLATKQGAGFLL